MLFLQMLSTYGCSGPAQNKTYEVFFIFWFLLKNKHSEYKFYTFNSHNIWLCYVINLWHIIFSDEKYFEVCDLQKKNLVCTEFLKLYSICWKADKIRIYYLDERKMLCNCFDNWFIISVIFNSNMPHICCSSRSYMRICSFCLCPIW